MADLGSSRDRQVEAEQTKLVITEVENRLRMSDLEIKACQDKAAKLKDERANLAAARERALPDIAIIQTKLQVRPQHSNHNRRHHGPSRICRDELVGESLQNKIGLTGIDRKIGSTYEPKIMLTNSPATTLNLCTLLTGHGIWNAIE
eukprot:1177237-Prorocentrum_minimum.AAC.1